MSVQLSPSTLEVLKNFASINTGLFFREGKTQKTISSSKTVFAEAILEEDLPASFGIYELNNLLAVLTMDGSNTPKVSFEDPNLIISFRDDEVTKFRCCKSDMLVVPPNKELDLGEVDIQFDLDESVLASILKAASILSSPHITVESDGTTLNLVAVDVSNDSSHRHSCKIGPGNGKSYQMMFRTENWKMMPGSYTVSISSKGIAKFVNKTRQLTYWLALETGSKTQK